VFCSQRILRCGITPGSISGVHRTFSPWPIHIARLSAGDQSGTAAPVKEGDSPWREKSKLSISSDGKWFSRPYVRRRATRFPPRVEQCSGALGRGRTLRNATERHRSATIEEHLSSLSDLNPTKLRELWRNSYGLDPPVKISDLLMRQAIAHRLQVKHFGGLNFSTRRVLKRLLEESGATRHKPHSRSTRVSDGTVLVREWHGATHHVTATEKGVLYREKLFRSLSEVAREITGTRWSGPLFFGLRTPRGEPRRGTK
jgi:hypothetical protein